MLQMPLVIMRPSILEGDKGLWPISIKMDVLTNTSINSYSMENRMDLGLHIKCPSPDSNVIRKHITIKKSS